MSNKLNPFEEQLKKSIQNHEVPYDAAEWDKLSSKLDASQGGSTFNKWVLSSVATLIVTAGVVLYLQNNTNTDTVVRENPSSAITLNTHSSSSEEKDIVINNSIEPSEIIPISEVTNGTANSEISETLNQEGDEDVRMVQNERTTLNVPSAPGESEIIESINPKNILEIQNDEDPLVLPEIEWNKKSICAGTEFKATLETNEEVIWELGNGIVVKGKELVYTFLLHGEYSVKAFLVESGVYTKSILINVKAKPDASFTVKETLRKDMVPVVQITANSEDLLSYKWSLGDGFSSHGEQIEHTYIKPRDYEISLHVVNKEGCFWSSFHRYTLNDEYNLLAPNSFSPNNDGENDEWIPVALTSGYFTFELNVYDRNGNLVFNTQDAERKFTGKVNGEFAKSGEVFIWKVITKDPNGIIQNYGGTILSIY